MTTTLALLASGLFDELDEAQVSDGVLDAATDPVVRRVVRYINQAYRLVFAIRPVPVWLHHWGTLATVAGTSAYALSSPADVDNLLQIKITASDTPITLVSEARYRTVVNPTLAAKSGQPEYAWASGGTLNLYPTPNAIQTLSILSCRKFIPLAAHGDTTLLPDEFDDVLHWGALAIGKLHENDPDAQTCMQTFNARLGDLRYKILSDGPVYTTLQQEAIDELYVDGLPPDFWLA